MDKINLGVGGSAHQRWHTALYYLLFLVFFNILDWKCFFPYLKNTFFIVKYSDIEKHKE